MIEALVVGTIGLVAGIFFASWRLSGERTTMQTVRDVISFGSGPGGPGVPR